MKNVVILALNAKFVHSAHAAWILAESIPKFAKFPHNVTVAECTINQPNEEIVAAVLARNPDVVGVSTYIWNAAKLPEILRLLRESLPNATFILGGHEATHNAEYWLNCGADFIIKGEGERTFPTLLDSIYNSESPAQIVESEPLTEFSNPQSDEYFASLEHKLGYIETSRGCPFQCAFCLSAGTNVRFMPLEQACAQIERLSKSGIRTMKFVDRTFNCNAARAFEIFEFVINLNTQVCFHFEVAADLFDERTLKLLATAPIGRIQFEAGLQSFHQPTLDASSRRTDTELAERNIRALVELGNIHLHVDLIAGLPLETLPNLMDSFDLAYNLGAEHLQLGFLKLLHGSRLRTEYNGVIQHSELPPYEISSSPWLSANELKIIKFAENALNRTRNKGRFLPALEYVLNVSKLRPFELYRALGEAVPNHGMPLTEYTQRVFEFFLTLPNIDSDELKNKF